VSDSGPPPRGGGPGPPPGVDPREASDQDLIRRFRAGDEPAFVALMDRHERRVYNLAYRMLGNTEDARDVTQEVFLSCFRHLGTFRGEAAFSTWLHRVTVNACHDLIRRRPPTASLDAGVADRPAGPDLADRAVLASDVQRALLAIPPEYRAVLVLHEVGDLPVGEVAAVLEIPVGTVKSRLHRGRVALARALGLPERPQEPDAVPSPSKAPEP
jgi:RNA polymerase sigma-70 factor (ECF subfamily)